MLLLGVLFLCSLTGAPKHSRELLVCMITYTLLSSLTVTSFLSMVVTRFIADQLYEENYETILPSFWGSSALMLIVGGILYGIFLFFPERDCWMGFCVWGFSRIDPYLECHELSDSDQGLQRDSSGICSRHCSDLSGQLVLFLGNSPCGNFTDRCLYWIRSHDALGYSTVPPVFSIGNGECIFFLKWVDQFLPLAFTGLFLHIGLFSHLVIMWAGPLQVKVQGLFVGAVS